VVRGAVAVGLEGNDSAVLHRKCRRHYGTDCSQRYEILKHNKKDRYIDEYCSLPYAANQMLWLLDKGQDLHVREPTHSTKSLKSCFWPGESRAVKFTLMACDEDQSPSHSKHKVSQHTITVSIANDSKATYKVADLTVELDDVPEAYLRNKRHKDGRKYYKVETVVHISLQSALEFFVTVEGEKFGSVTVNYD
jgi:hypothetical protein